MSAVSQQALLMAVGVTHPSRTYAGRVSSGTDQTTFTFTGAAIGAASAARHVVLTIAWRSTTTISSVTIGGAAATVLVLAPSTGGSRTSIYIASIPAGTTADIVVTFSGNTTRCIVDVYAAYNLTSATAVATSSSGGSNPVALSLNTAANGLAFGVAITNTAGATPTWAGLLQDANAATEIQASCASLVTAGASTPLTASCTWSSAADPNGCAVSLQ